MPVQLSDFAFYIYEFSVERKRRQIREKSVIWLLTVFSGFLKKWLATKLRNKKNKQKIFW